MVPPSQRRPRIFRGGVLQIMVTRACDLACFHCTQGSNLGGKPVIMTPEEFEQSVDSLGFYPGARSADRYFGVVGVFGGNPTMSRYFDDYCRIMRERVPPQQRGIWTNNLRGKGSVCRETFNPAVSNINVHQSEAAYQEFQRDWPEALSVRARHTTEGLQHDSEHVSPFVAMKDVIADEEERWRRIGECDVNQHWSALIGVVPGVGLRAYFCELAYAQAALHATAEDTADWPDTGLPVTRGWWRAPMATFGAQVRQHCHACGIPLRANRELANGGVREVFSEMHRAIAKSKVRGRPVEFVQIGTTPLGPEKPSTEYLVGVTPR